MENNPTNKQNLKPFPKGTSGNPKGRPKDLPELKAVFEEQGPEKVKEVIESLFKQAKKGNVRAAELILDRIYGKQTISLDVKAELTVTDARAALIAKLGAVA